MIEETNGKNWAGFYKFLQDSIDLINVPCEYIPGLPLDKKFGFDEYKNVLYISGESYLPTMIAYAVIESFTKEVSRKVYGQRTENVAENLKKSATSHADDCCALFAKLHEVHFPEEEILAIIAKLRLLRDIAKVFNQEVQCMLLAMTKEHKKIALKEATETLSTTFQQTYDEISHAIVHLYMKVDLFDQNQELLLSIPYVTYLQLLTPEEIGKEPHGLDLVIKITEKNEQKTLSARIPVTRHDYEIGLRWLETKSICPESIASLMRFARIFKLKELEAQIDQFAKDKVPLQELLLQIKDLYNQVQVISGQYHWPFQNLFPIIQAKVKENLFPNEEILALVEKMSRLDEIAKIFNQEVQCELLAIAKDHQKLAQKDEVYKNLSQVIAHLHMGIDLFDQDRKYLLTIPYATFLELHFDKEPHGLDLLLKILKRNEQTFLTPSIPVTLYDYEVGLKWLETKSQWLETRCISLENVDSLIRFATIFNLAKLAGQINQFAKYNFRLKEIPVSIEELHRQVQFAVKYKLGSLEWQLAQRFEVFVKQFISNLNLEASGAVSQIALFIAQIERYQFPTLLFQKGRPIPPTVRLISGDKWNASEVSLVKLCWASRVFRFAVNDCKEIPYEFKLSSLPNCSPKVLNNFAQTLNEGRMPNDLGEENYLDFFFLADELDIPFVYQSRVKHLETKICNFSLNSKNQAEYQNLLNQVLPRLPIHFKPSVIENVTKAIKNYFSSYESEKDDLQSWIDFSIRHNLVEIKKRLSKRIESGLCEKIREATKQKRPPQWYKNLEHLPPMYLNYSDVAPYSFYSLRQDPIMINIENLKGLHLEKLDLRKVEINREDLKKLVQIQPMLTELHLNCNALADQDLLILVPLPLLKLELDCKVGHITMKGCTVLLEKLYQQHKSDYVYLKFNNLRVYSVYTPHSSNDLEFIRDPYFKGKFEDVLKPRIWSLDSLKLSDEDKIVFFRLARELKISSQQFGL